MLALILGTLGAIIYHGWLYGISFPTYNRFYFMSEYMADIEEYMQANFPFSKQLKNSAVRLQMLSGEHEFNKIFIGGDILIESLNQPQAEVLAKNQEEIQKFAESVSTPTHVLYLPTKYAIKQKELPENAELFAFNQKNFIEQSYSALQGKATTVDVYPLLFANSDKYLYYRTDPNLTGLGAYYVYTALIQRLGLSPLGQEDFNLRHIQHDFYGSTYQDSAYKEITPDIVTLYQPRSAARSYTVTHNNDYEYTYNTLYPEHLQDLKGGLSVILGGDTGDITIGANLRKQKSLLVFGDRLLHAGASAADSPLFQDPFH